ncbi:hypothetical protein CCACVL1_12488 [Corchorus capsularis]|uniref:Uncharacterized protein n=1 Tax=Corchorus capsularis TaxID=210143 RepID=A0A1R3IFF2_COCAP|nr:hypothetical protein CCACVL1_12488 [Corchorus capsularis]
MKRQGSNNPDGKNEGKKRSRRSGVVAKEEGDKGKKTDGGMKLEHLLGWEEWPWMRGVADEQMSWGSLWSPFWDVDFVDKAYAAFFNDVAWDDDIWNLKSIMEIPTPNP